jgi:hypothetical protein
MTDLSRFELRIAQLIDAYADHAPSDVDPISMTRSIAAAERGRGSRVARPIPSRDRLRIGVLVIVALGVIIGGAIAVGRPVERDRDPNIPDGFRVGPFIGVPPVGAAPSRPEVGKLVLKANGRCTSEGAFCFVWIYADGRLIWLRDGALPYGANEHSTGLLEQHLAPSGVERLVAAFRATRACIGGELDEPLVCTPSMPGPAPFPRIPHPGWIDRSWGLAASDWEDPSIWGFVPSTVGACFLESGELTAGSDYAWQRVEPARVLGLLPPGAADLLRGREIAFPPSEVSGPRVPMTCFGMTADEARALDDVLSLAGLERVESMAAYWLGYQLGAPRPFVDAVLLFGPILPHGEWIVSGGG